MPCHAFSGIKHQNETWWWRFRGNPRGIQFISNMSVENSTYARFRHKISSQRQSKAWWESEPGCYCRFVDFSFCRISNRHVRYVLLYIPLEFPRNLHHQVSFWCYQKKRDIITHKGYRRLGPMGVYKTKTKDPHCFVETSCWETASLTRISLHSLESLVFTRHGEPKL